MNTAREMDEVYLEATLPAQVRSNQLLAVSRTPPDGEASRIANDSGDKTRGTKFTYMPEPAVSVKPHPHTKSKSHCFKDYY